MPVRRSRLVAALATVLAAGTLAGTAPAPASAEPATTTYECTFLQLGEVDVALTVDVTNLPGRLPVGVPVAASTWDVRATLHLDELATASLFSRSDDLIAKAHGFETLLGGKPVLLDLASGAAVLPFAEPLDVPMAGTNRAFTPKELEDDAPLELPDIFTLDLFDGEGTLLDSVECEWWDGDLGVIGTVSVVKQQAAMTRKVLKKPVKSTKRAKVLVTVLSQTGQAAAGEVRAAIGARTLLVRDLTDGRVTLRLPRLRVGKHRVTLTYLGTRIVAQTTRNVTVKVVRPNARTS